MASNSRIITRGVSSLTELLSARAAEDPGRVAYTFLKDESSTIEITYGELESRSLAVAARLAERTQAGDRALLLYPPGIDFLVGFFGCLYAGVVSAPLPLPGARTGLEKLALVRKDTGARLALTVSQLAAERIGGGSAAGIEIVSTDSIDASNGSGPAVRETAGDVAYLQYTSGSTSVPRGVMVTHENVLHNLANIDDGFRHTGESVAVSWLPHFHDMGLIYGLLGPLFIGMPCYLLSPATFVQRPRTWLEAITRYKATHSGGPNFAYDLCVRRIPEGERAGLDLSSWELAFNGAEPVHAETLERFSRAFAGNGFRKSAFHPAYGLAEASLKISSGVKGAGPTYFRADSDALAKNEVREAANEKGPARIMVGCGQAGRDTRVAVVDPETKTECGDGTVGEIWAKGPGVAQGYWNRPDDTAQTFGAALADTGEGPFLRTGDLGFIRDGELFIAGRRKDLIIIRGMNHHPSDIEITARKAHPAVATSIAAAFSVEVEGSERLVLVMEAGRREPEDPEAIAHSVRQFVAERHEVRVYAFVLVRKGTIPKTSSGKIQRGLCRSQYEGKKLRIIFESLLAGATLDEGSVRVDREFLLAARGDQRRELTLSYLRGLLGRVLGIRPDELDPDQPLTASGIDSLMAMELQNRIETDIGVTVTAVELLEGVTFDSLAALVLAGLDSELRTVNPIRARRADQAPLSFEQERLWLLDKITPGNAAYHVPYGFRLRGPLDVAALERALGAAVEQQESLRSIFSGKGSDGRSLVQDPSPVRIEVEDLGNVDESGRLSRAVELARREIRKPFDLNTGPLIRFRVYRLADEDHVALLVMHHIVSDLLSVRLLLEDLLVAYQAVRTGDEPALETLPVQYGDYAAWQREQLRGERLERLTEYWRGNLEGAPRLELPTDRPRPKSPTFDGGSESIRFPRELTDGLRRLGRREGATLFTVLLAGFEALAARCSGQSDLVIGTTNANRNRPELERLVGFFAAPLVLRTELAGDPTFREIVDRVQETLLDAYAHQNLPFAKVVEAAHPGRQSSYTPLFQVMFSLVKSLLPATELPDLDLEPLDIDPNSTDFDLFVNIIEGPKALRALVVYSKDLYDGGTVRDLMSTYLDILARAVAEPDTKLSEFDVAPKLTRQPAAPAATDDTPRMVVSATFTSEPVEEIVSFWMRELDFDYTVKFAPYNQVFQQLLDPAGLVGRNANGINVALVRFEDWTSTGEPAGLVRLEENVHTFIDALRAAASRIPAPFLVCLCPASTEFLAADERAAFTLRMEETIASAFHESGSVNVVTSTEIAALYPVAEYDDPHGDSLGRVPYTPEFFAALGTMIIRRIHAMRTEPFKVVTLDCDQTLWSGICGEDGPEGVEIDEHRHALQQFMVDQQEAGMLLTLASKNNEEDVWAVFDAHPEMPLSRERFVSWRINWEPKSEGLRDMAEELQLGLDSLLFVDDSPTECAEVEAGAPDVLTLQLPKDPTRIVHFIRHIWAFDHLARTEEDKKRTAMYGQRLERRKLQKKVATLAEFLEALDLEIEIGPMTPDQLPRVSQLTQRTNQFNLTSVRRTEGEIQQYLDGGECLTVQVSDRFGAYGLVGVALFETAGAELVVDAFLLSCRVLGRGVEHRILASLGMIAGERGLETVVIPYVKTAKNRPALKFIEGVAGDVRIETGDGARYPIPAAVAAGVTYNPDAKPGAPVHTEAPSADPVETGERSIDYTTIALELSDASKILERVREAGQSDAPSAAAHESPRTPLEGQLAEIWAEMLNVPKVGVNDNFFDLGGHSLLAVQLLSRVREEFDVDLSLDVVFSGVFSVAELAKAIELFEIEQAGSEEYQELLDELEGLSDEEVRALLEEEEKTQSGDGAA